MKTMMSERPRVRKTRRIVRAQPDASPMRRPVERVPAEDQQVAEVIRTFTVRWEW